MQLSLLVSSALILATVLWPQASGTSMFIRSLVGKMAALNKNRFRRNSEPIKSPTMTQFHVMSFVTSRYTRVVVESVVRNVGRFAQDISVEMRLPKTAFISNFSMEIEGRTYVGIVKEKAAAKREYLAAVSQGQSAGLVTAKTRESQTFDVSVNIAAGSAVTFRLDYQELLKRRLGLYNHVIYADPGQLVEDFKVEVQITEPSGISQVDAKSPGAASSDGRDEPSTGLVNIRRSGTQAHILYQPNLAQQKLLRTSDRSFLVTYDVTRETLGGELLIKDGYFVHFFAPSNLPVMPKNVVFVIDKSGSMWGRKMEQTKAAFKTILDDLSPQDKFNIITFSYGAETWQPNEMLLATGSNVKRAKDFVQGIYASGGTNMELGTRMGISLLETVSSNATNSFQEASMLMILTDGEPTVGVTSTSEIRKKVKRQVAGRYSIFCLGFGKNLDHSFLNKLATENQGISRRIYDDADAALQLKGFYDEVASPLLAHVIIKYSGLAVHQTTKRKFDNFFDGSEIPVVGALVRGQPHAELSAITVGTSISGNLILTTKGKEFDETFVEDGFDMEKLWAYLTIQQLQQKKERIDGDDAAEVERINKEVLQLSLKYNFVTKLTSMVVTKPGEDTVVGGKPPPRPKPIYSSLQSISSHLFANPPPRVPSPSGPMISGRSFALQPQIGRTVQRSYFSMAPPQYSALLAAPVFTYTAALTTRWTPAAYFTTSRTTTAPTTAGHPANFPTTTAFTTTAPTTAGPTANSPTTTVLTTTAPTTAGPTANSPTTTVLTTTAPTTAGHPANSPTTTAFTTTAPTTAGPTANPPTTIVFTTTAPTTADPTTAGPTANSPTTTVLTTTAPTTAGHPANSPTTTAFTTTAPTTAGPTANSPTTTADTTSGPTAISSTTAAHTTSESTKIAPTEANANINVNFPSNPLAIATSCGSTIDLDRQQNISTPRFPGLYPASTQCVWRVRNANNRSYENPSVIRLSFQSFDLESSASCHRDRVLVYKDFDVENPNPTIRSFCGYEPETDHVDAFNQLVIVFESDDLVQGRGFQAKLDIVN